MPKALARKPPLTEQRALAFLIQRGYNFVELRSKKEREAIAFEKHGKTGLVAVENICCKVSVPVGSHLGKQLAKTYLKNRSGR
jgi:hypothetical protein